MSDRTDDAPRDDVAGGGPTGADDRPQADGGATASANAEGSDNDKLVAAIVSFLIPGLGHFLVEGKQERGVAILIAWVVWLFLGWGVLLFVGSAVLTALGFLVIPLFLIPVLWIFVPVIELAIHALAAVDAHRQSRYVDKVTTRVNEYR